MNIILLIVVLLLLFGGGAYWGYRGEYVGGPGISVGTILLIILIVWLLRGR